MGTLTDLDQQSITHIAGIARHYLETLIDKIYRYPDDATRRKMIQNSKAKDIVVLLESLQSESYYLSRIAILEIKYYLGEEISSKDIVAFVNECIILEEWPTAALATQFLLTLSFEEGKNIFPVVMHGLKKRRATKLRIKTRAKYRYEQLGRRVPLYILNGRFLMPVNTIVIEVIFLLKKFIWRFDSMVNLMRIETGFISIGKVRKKGKSLSVMQKEF